MQQQRQLLGELFDQTGLTDQEIADRLGATIYDVRDMRNETVYRTTGGTRGQIGSLMQITSKYKLKPGLLGSLLKRDEV
jgi:hypothetical protein